MRKFFLNLLVLALRLLDKTLRWEGHYDFSKDRGKIYVFLHGHFLGLELFGKDRGIYALSSLSRDGEISAYVLKRLGYRVIRGSSEMGRRNKGARRATLKLLKVLKEGGNVGITMDGPKGPYMSVAKGIIYLAQKTGAPIVPFALSFKPSITLRTWDRFQIPLPFSKAKVLVGREIFVREGDSFEEKEREIKLEMERLLRELNAFN